MKGTAIITDHTNGIEAQVIYNPKQEGTGYLSAFKKKFWGGGSSNTNSPTVRKQFTDTVCITISRPSQTDSKEKEVLSTGCGSWLSHIQFDGQVYWQIDQRYCDWESVGGTDGSDMMLPSDSSARLDHQALKQSDYETAEKEKLTLENAQRNDKKIRLEAAKRRTKK